MSNCKYRLRKLSVGLVSVGIMFITTTVMANETPQLTTTEITASSKAVEVPGDTVDTPEPDAASETEEVPTVTDSPSDPKSITAEVENKGTEKKQTSEATALNKENSSLQPKSRNKRSTDSVSVEPQFMEVEKVTIDKGNTELNLKDNPDKSKQLIKNRDGEQREIAKITREVKVSENPNELDVTITVTPKEIDNGADVIVLLDTSKKMTEEQFKNAKEGITQLVDTLTGQTNDERNRNTVRLIDFYREVGKPISLSGLTKEELGKKLDQVRQKAYDRWNWGVDLQGAIHEAREIFKREAKNNSSLKKHQHIVLFSQGEATLSYSLKESAKKDSKRIDHDVTAANPYLPWPFVFDSTSSNANMISDAKKIIEWANTLGLKLDTAKNVIGVANQVNGVISWLGINPTEYITLKEYSSDKLKEGDFDYNVQLGEGYHNYSFAKTNNKNEFPLKSKIMPLIKSKIKTENNTALGKVLDWIGVLPGYNILKEKALGSFLDNIFYERTYMYYNHNLSAQAEAKMAQSEGITFYSFDLKKSNSSNKFDKYLTAMSEGSKLFKEVDNLEKFKNMVTELTITDTFDNGVSVKGDKNEATKNDGEVVLTKASNNTSWLFSPTKENLKWTISKEQFLNAYKKGNKLTLNYKLVLDKDKFMNNNKAKTRKKRSIEDSKLLTPVTSDIISNQISYKINSKSANGQKLDDVKLTYTKEMVPVPEIDGEVIEPLAPQLPELPPIIEHGTSFDFTEDTVNQLPLEHGHYEPNTTVTVTEDTKPDKIDTIIGGNVIDFTEDTLSNQSGHSNDATIIEDTKQPEIIMGGQANIVDMVEETQSGMSGFNEATVIEEDARPKLQFHFENKEPILAINKVMSQTPITRVANELPKTGDNKNLEVFFTATALTIIGAVGLLGKKQHENCID